MASIQKRGKTYQYTVSRMENGKSKPIRKGGFRTKKEAKIAAAEIEIQLGKGILPQLKKVPIDDYFNKWVKLYKFHLSPVTKRHYEYTLNVIKTYFDGKALQDIGRHDYQLFLNEYGSNKSKESVEKLNSHIRACVKDAVEEQIIHHDFTRKAVITWSTPAKKPIEKHLNFGESKVLLKELYERIDDDLTYSLILLGLSSGMRFGEMVGLTRNDFDFEKNTITISKTWGYLKRNVEGFSPTKNEQSNRTIRMDTRTMNHFQKIFSSTPDNANQLVFFNPNSKYKVINNTVANNQLKNILFELGIEPVTIHGLRHTHASMLIYKNVSIYYVSERLGHKDSETTRKKYAHVIKELREVDEQKTISIFSSYE